MRIRLNLLLGLTIGALVLGFVGVALVWTPYSAVSVNLQARLQPPTLAHFFGTDEFGRDVLSRAMIGSIVSLTVSISSVFLAIVVGTLIGVVSGYLRGWPDRIAMACNDTLLAFPGILLALSVLTILPPSAFAVTVALAIAYTPSMVRVVRGTVLSLRQREYVEASRVAGNGEAYTMLRHVLPNCIAPITILATSMIAWALLAESALSFLGLGVPPPAPSWGNMLSAARPYMGTAVWLQIAPGVCIALTLLGVNLLGDSLRDWLDPRDVR